MALMWHAGVHPPCASPGGGGIERLLWGHTLCVEDLWGIQARCLGGVCTALLGCMSRVVSAGSLGKAGLSALCLEHGSACQLAWVRGAPFIDQQQRIWELASQSSQAGLLGQQCQWCPLPMLSHSPARCLFIHWLLKMVFLTQWAELSPESHLKQLRLFKNSFQSFIFFTAIQIHIDIQ